MENVRNLVNEIRTGLTQKSSSQKDEVRVMKAMLNDREYVVDVYGGAEGETFCPAKEAREMISSVIKSTTKISGEEATKLADAHEFNNKEASSMIGISKEFVNTYLETGRKLPLGGRAQSDVSLIQKEVAESERAYPKRVGVNEDGTPKYDRAMVPVKAHKSVKVIAPCPEWIK